MLGRSRNPHACETERGLLSVEPISHPHLSWAHDAFGGLDGELAQLIQGAGSAMLIVGADGHVVAANQRAIELFHDVQHGPQTQVPKLAELLAPLEELHARRARDHRPTIDVARGGVSRTFGYSLSRGQRDLHLLVVADITRVRLVEEERDRLLKLATVGELMPMLLHETKNPLSAAVTMLELLLEEHAEPALMETLHAVLTEIRRAVLTLDGVGSVGRNMRSSGFHAIDYAIRDVCALLTPRAKRQGVELTCDVENLPLLPLDPASVRGVVLNLVTNAIHACPRGTGCEVTVRFALEDGAALLDVIDTGTGMTPEVLARCRELFFTTKRSGSGIGLALSDQLVEDAGGRMDIESHPGRGTRISIRLPGLVPAPHGE